MASVRGFKKNIDIIMSMALSDCFFALEYNSKVDEKAVMEIAAEIVRKHREFRIRANRPKEKGDRKMVKKYYRDLAHEAHEAADKALEALSAEVKKVAE